MEFFNKMLMWISWKAICWNCKWSTTLRKFRIEIHFELIRIFPESVSEPNRLITSIWSNPNNFQSLTIRNSSFICLQTLPPIRINPKSIFQGLSILFEFLNSKIHDFFMILIMPPIWINLKLTPSTFNPF